MSTFTVDSAAVRTAGLTLVGEPIAIDLVNTEKLAAEPPLDLLPDDGAHHAFWELQAARMAIPAQLPTLEQVRHLRSAIRSLLQSRLADRAAEPWAIQSVNRYASSAPSSPQLTAAWTMEIEWHATDGATALLGAVARSSIDILAGPDGDRLHKCAADNCSMLFIATNAKRQWCTSAGCGNRNRVARHSSRQRQSSIAAELSGMS